MDRLGKAAAVPAERVVDNSMHKNVARGGRLLRDMSLTLRLAWSARSVP